MADKQTDIVNLELHPQAQTRARERINEFGTSMLLQAKLIAYKTKADLVLSRHIDEAVNTMYTEHKQSWTKELLIIVGGALFGAFIQGFVTELSTGNKLLIAIYTLLGFVGMLLVFVGLRR